MEPSGKLSVRVASVESLPKPLRQEMFRLFSRFYEAISQEQFEKDLNEKNDVMLAYDSGNKTLQGFSTIKLYTCFIKRQEVQVMFSGDTIVHPDYWGQTALHRAFFKYILGKKLRSPLTPFYWFLISKGYKTYLGLARNVPVHWPRYDRETPAFELELLNHLCRDRFGEAWKPELGLLKFKECKGRLKEGVAPIDKELLSNPQIRFFQQRNPGHLDGDELCCLGLINFQVVHHFLARFGKKTLTRFANRYREGYEQVADRPS